MSTQSIETRDLLSDERGAGFAESLAVIPVLVALFGAIGFFQSYYATQLDARTEVRRCVWTFANGGCGNTPDGCGGVLSASAASAPSDARGRSDVAEADSAIDGMRRALPVPVLGDLLGSVVGTTATARAQRNVPIPSWAGSGTRDASCTGTTMCNERPRTVEDLLRGAFCSAVGGAGGIFGC